MCLLSLVETALETLVSDTMRESYLWPVLTCPALHYAYVDHRLCGAAVLTLPLSVIHGSTDVLEHLLEAESIHLDLRNRLQGDTPLHIAVRQRYEDHPAARLYIGRR